MRVYIYKSIGLVFFLMALSGWVSCARAEEGFKEIKDYHFVVYYKSDEHAELARQVLREAERYYVRIADQIGYSRYSNFWTWEHRVKILIYDNQAEFAKATNLPAWSQAASIRDMAVFHTKVIVTFAQEAELMQNILPHEICHLIVKDFIGFDKSLPLWFDEGLAQLQESDKREVATNLMREVVAKNSAIPFDILKTYDVRREQNTIKVMIFYAQSISVLDFLIKKYGIRRFQQLCSYLHDGKSFDEAFQKAYISLFDSFDAVEKKWLKYIHNI